MKKSFNLSILISLLIMPFHNTAPTDPSTLSQNPIMIDTMNCAQNTDTDTCQDVKMTSNIYQCCEAIITMNGRSISSCSIWFKENLSNEEKESMIYNYQEASTFLSVMNPDSTISNLKTEYNCKNNKITLDYGIAEFTDEDKEIMKKENYCYRLYYEGLAHLGVYTNFIGEDLKEVTKEDCMNALTIPKSKNSCGYASFKFKLDDDSVHTINMCLPLSIVTLNKKKLDTKLENDFNGFLIYTIDGVGISSFDAEITSKNGEVLKYDSSTGTLTGNKSEKLSKSLFILLSLFLLMI